MTNEVNNNELSIKDFRSLCDFVGRDWLNRELPKYFANPEGYRHPFLAEYNNINNSDFIINVTGMMEDSILVKAIISPFLKYSYLGRLIEKQKSYIPNPSKFKSRLKDYSNFGNALSELLICGILIDNGFNVKWLKESQGIKTPDFEVEKNGQHFVAEVTTLNHSDYFINEGDYGMKLIKEIWLSL